MEVSLVNENKVAESKRNPEAVSTAFAPHGAGTLGRPLSASDWNELLNIPRLPENAITEFPRGARTGCQYLWAENSFCQTPGSLLRYIFLVVTPFSFPDKEVPWAEVRGGSSTPCIWRPALPARLGCVCPAFSWRCHSCSSPCHLLSASLLGTRIPAAVGTSVLDLHWWPCSHGHCRP